MESKSLQQDGRKQKTKSVTTAVAVFLSKANLVNMAITLRSIKENCDWLQTTISNTLKKKKSTIAY